MGTDWGAYENSGGRGIRCGLTYNWQAVGHGDGNAHLDLDCLTQNNAKYNNDAQSLNISGEWSFTVNYTNDQGTGVITRNSRTLAWSYPGNSYGSSPGNVTIKSLLSGADNGVTPGVQVTLAIPARPYGVPDAPFWQSAQRQSDGAILVQWLQSPTAGEPYQAVYVDRYTYGFESWTRIMNGGATGATSGSVMAGAQANRKYTYRIWAANAAGSSATVQTNDEYTTPSAPVNFTRSQSGTTQTLTWTNAVGYGEYGIQIQESVNGGAWTWMPSLPAGTTTVSYTGRSVANKYKYRANTLQSAGYLSSAWTPETTESSGVTTAPAAPTALAPASDIVVDGLSPVVLSWTYNTTDGSDQTQFELQHREVGTSTWNATSPPVNITATRNWTLAGGTYDYSKHVEWQVRTWGVDATKPSAWASASFLTADEVPVKYPLVINLSSGRVEALSGGGAAGVGDANVFYYEQNYTTATTTVGYNHGLGTKGLEIEFYDSGGVQRFGDVTKTADTITMTFYHPVTGLMIVYGAVAA